MTPWIALTLYTVLVLAVIGALLYIAHRAIKSANSRCRCDRHRGPHNHEQIT